MTPSPSLMARRRPSSRLLVLDQAHRLLLFRFSHRTGVLAGQDYWATPGGGLQAGETFGEAAIRELREETGIMVRVVEGPIAQREFTLQMPDGEQVVADERFFVVRVGARTVSPDKWTTRESEVMVEHRWWTAADVEATDAMVWPDNLPHMLRESGYW